MSGRTTNQDGSRWSEQHEELVLVIDSATESNPAEGSISLPAVLEYVTEVKLVSYTVSGIPETSGVTNYEGLHVRLGDFYRGTTNTGNSGLFLPTPTSTTTQSYTGRILRDASTPLTTNLIPWRVLLPDRSPATASDYSRIYIILSITRRTPMDPLNLRK